MHLEDVTYSVCFLDLARSEIYNFEKLSLWKKIDSIINGSYNKFDKFRNASVFISMKSYRVLFTSYNFAYIRPKTIDKGVVLTRRIIMIL